MAKGKMGYGMPPTAKKDKKKKGLMSSAGSKKAPPFGSRKATD